MEKTAYLVLENGQVFKGRSFGAEGSVTAEVVFTTGMTGYLETLTDKSYYGQIVVQTFPLIGNYGVIPADFESDRIGPSAYIVKQWCQNPSNFRSECDIDAFLKSRGIVGLCGIDTRSLTKTIRENGVMNGCITPDPDSVDIAAIRSYRVTDAVDSVTSDKIENFKAEGESRFKVVLLDFGQKENIKRQLRAHGCDVIDCPARTTPHQIAALKPDGIMLSNGPGDPSENTEIIGNLTELLKLNIPIFGICLGHQLLALASGFETKKLKYGHRGANQPVKFLEDGRVYITSQNHGYAVTTESIDRAVAHELFVNVNDHTCEGIAYHNHPAFSVQFHPEAHSGPLDTSWLFDRFCSFMEVNK
ncbi:MAG: carbamoyl phosphate synthase small subunit [Eubacteriales bacterium]